MQVTEILPSRHFGRRLRAPFRPASSATSSPIPRVARVDPRPDQPSPSDRPERQRPGVPVRHQWSRPDITLPSGKPRSACPGRAGNGSSAKEPRAVTPRWGS